MLPRHKNDPKALRDANAALRVQLSVAESLADSLRAENEALRAKVAALETKNDQLSAAAADYSKEVVSLREELRWYTALRFSPSSQRVTDFVTDALDQQLLFNLPLVEQAIEAARKTRSTKVAAHERKHTGGRKVIPSHFPRDLIEHDLPDEQKICTQCAIPHPLKRIGGEERECYRIKPAQVTVEHHIKYTYVCEELNTGVVTASAPPTILPKTNASASLVAHLIAKKFDFSMPIHRTCRELQQSGVELSTGTACSWVNIVGGQKVVPVVNLLNEAIFDGQLMQVDETYLRVLKSHKAPTSNHFMVVRTGGAPGRRIILYNYIPSRTRAALRELLIGPEGPYQGKVVTDGLELYDDICDELKLLHFGCWQHARQYYYKADKVSELPSSRTLAHAAIVDYIRPIFKIEDKIEALRTKHEQRGEVLSSAQVLQIRQEQSRPVVEAFKGWVDRLMPGVAPKSALGRALAYTGSQWRKLTGFLDHDVPIHNNRPEQQNKHFAVGRKNWWHSYSEGGARASANLLSLVLTCRANGVVAFDYLEYLFELLPAAANLADIEALLPWNAKPVLEQRRMDREDAARLATRRPQQARNASALPATPVLLAG